MPAKRKKEGRKRVTPLQRTPREEPSAKAEKRLVTLHAGPLGREVTVRGTQGQEDTGGGDIGKEGTLDLQGIERGSTSIIQKNSRLGRGEGKKNRNYKKGRNRNAKLHGARPLGGIKVFGKKSVRGDLDRMSPIGTLLKTQISVFRDFNRSLADSPVGRSDALRYHDCGRVRTR